MSIALTAFARQRLFAAGARPGPWAAESPEAVLAHLNREPPLAVLPGYAPFCVLHVHRNWTDARCQAMPITEANRRQLRSAYEARTAAELPVLVRWFEGMEAPRAAYLLVILYDRAQLVREGDAIDADWGVVGCLCTLQPVETPMTPITMMRNALGVEQGGSGVPLDIEAYRRSVDFWAQHAQVRG